MKYVYPARFYPETNGAFSVIFVDFQGCVTQGENLFDALMEARDALEFWLSVLEDDKKPIPKPTDFKSIDAAGNEFVVPIPADTDDWRRKNARW